MKVQLTRGQFHLFNQHTAKIKDEDYPEKDGKYYVTGVTTAINESGFKRTVKIGIKVSV